MGILEGTATWQSHFPNSFLFSGHYRVKNVEILTSMTWVVGPGEWTLQLHRRPVDPDFSALGQARLSDSHPERRPPGRGIPSRLDGIFQSPSATHTPLSRLPWTSTAFHLTPSSSNPDSTDPLGDKVHPIKKYVFLQWSQGPLTEPPRAYQTFMPHPRPTYKPRSPE